MPNRALILKEPWAGLVVTGKKTVELRTMATTKIGQEIYIAKSGTKSLVGKVTIKACRRLTEQEYLDLADQHLAPGHPTNKKIYGWFLSDAVAFSSPRPYKHPQGAQIWVKIKS